MPIIYRQHKESLEESLKDAVIFESEELMKRYVVNGHNDFIDHIGFSSKNHIDIDDVVLGDDVINDERIGWKDTRYVCLKKGYGEDYMAEYGCPQAIGFCATIFPEPEKFKLEKRR